MNINPISGSLKIVNKVFANVDQIISEIGSPTYMCQVVCMMRNMTNLCREMIDLQLYSIGKKSQFPRPSFILKMEEEESKKQSRVFPDTFLGAVITTMTAVDTNG